MALTRKMLDAMGIESNKIEQIIEAHAESVEALKEQRDGYKAEADKLTEVQKELDALKANGGEYKTRYEKLEADFNAYKETIEAKDTRTAKEKAVRAYFDSKGIKGNALEVAMRGSSAEIDSVELKDGAISDSKALDELISGVFSGLVSTTEQTGVKTPNPTGSGKSAITREEFARMSYSDRLKIYNENPEVYSELSK